MEAITPIIFVWIR